MAIAALARHWHRWRDRRAAAAAPPIPHALWQATLAAYPFLAALAPGDTALLRRLAGRFLATKQFTGAHGLVVSDAMALAVAAQACLPLVGWARRLDVRRALAAYDDFVGIVLHAGDEMRARRESTDAAGVVHRYDELLVGEAMERGPITLAWRAVTDAATQADTGFNVVIHEFAHKLDLRDGMADGCPPLPRGFLGATSTAAARARWLRVLQPAFEAHRERCIRAERFGDAPPWLDAYAATSPAEFFAVACEGYFVQRNALAAELPTLLPLFDAYFAAEA